VNCGSAPLEAVSYNKSVPKPSIATQGREFMRHVVPAVIKPARTLWNEVIGFLFLCIAIIFAFNAFRTYQAIRNLTPGENEVGHMLKLAMSLFFVVLMGGYGISSFRRARKISRS
jgi:hypothetical protein